MPKYHVNTEGDVAACRATKNPCPFGEQLHFATKVEAERGAEQYIEQRVELETFPRPWDANFLEQQARLYWEQDQSLGSGANPYHDWGYRDHRDRRFYDYKAGFELGQLHPDPGSEPRFEAMYAADTERERPGDPRLFDDIAFKLGFARALRMVARRPTLVENPWITAPIADYGIDPYTGAGEKYNYMRNVRNPFARGQRVLIPAGTEYRVAEDGKQVTKATSQPQWVKVATSSVGHTSGSVGKVFLTPAEITYAATPNGLWRSVTVTPELLSANGEPTFEQPLVNEDWYLTPIHHDIRKWEKLPKTW